MSKSPTPPAPPCLRLPPPNNVLERPAQPSDDPSVADAHNAICYEKEAFIARGVYWLIHVGAVVIDTPKWMMKLWLRQFLRRMSSKAGLEEVRTSMCNLHKLYLSTDGAAPPWFHATMAATLGPMNECLDRIDEHLTRIDECLLGIEHMQVIMSKHFFICQLYF